MTKSYEELLADMTEIIAKIYEKGYDKGYEQGKFDAQLDRIDGMTADELTKEVQQDRRDRIIEKAKKDIEELKDDYDGSYTVDNGGHRLHQYACTAEYIVNKDKRTVVVLMRGRSTSRVRARGIAKAHPNDCFNVHIGKAIALRRALGLEVPSEYLNAPQPTEVRVGDVVTSYDGYVDPYEVSRVTEWDAFDSDGYYLGLERCKITDDSREEVSE